MARTLVGMKHRSFAVVAVVATLVVLPACKFAKVGARCSTAQGPARTTTHVLFCVGGKWKQSLTIGQAADFIIGQWPGSATSTSGDDVYSSPYQPLPAFDLTVTNRAGRPAANTPVTLSLAGPGISGVEKSEFRTDARGIFRFVKPRAMNVNGPGVYTLTWSGPHPTPILTQRIHQASWPTSVAVLSGADQTIGAGSRLAPITFEVRDSGGVAVAGAKVKTTDSRSVVTSTTPFGRATVETDPLTQAGQANIGLVAYEVGPFGDITKASGAANYTVKPGPVDDGLIDWDEQTAAVDTQFGQALSVRTIDAWGNTVPNIPVSFTAIPGVTGASGTIVTSGNSGTSGYARAFAHANSIAGEWNVRAEIAGVGTYDFTLENI